MSPYHLEMLYYYDAIRAVPRSLNSKSRVGAAQTENISESKVAGSNCNIEIINHQVASSTLPNFLLICYLIYNFKKRVN
jgi:hypothetical protein